MKGEIRNLIDARPMSGFQVQIVAICCLINMLDGFDVLVIAFTAPTISDDWGLSGSALGIVLSAGLAGMALGAMFLAPYADQYGRRKIVLASLVIISAGMFLSAMSSSVLQLTMARILTGIGIGASLASLNIVVVEYTSVSKRGFCLGLLHIAYPLGAIIGGSIAAFIISRYGWQPVFLLGGILTILMFPVVFWRMPESLDFLVSIQPQNALARLNNLLARMGHDQVESLPEVTADKTGAAVGFKDLWNQHYRHSTIISWTTFFMTMFSVYFVLSWTPKLLVNAGLSVEQGISGGLILNLGGMVGQLLLGYISARFNLQKLICFYMIMAVIAMIGFGLLTQDLSIALVFAVFIGFFLFGTITGLYILTPRFYPVEIRATGLGWAIGVGRIGAIISPFLTGVLLDANWQISSIFFGFSLAMIAAAIMIALNIKSKRAVEISWQ